MRKVQAFGDRLKTKYADALDEQGRDYITRMQNATGRMQSLIDGVLGFSRVSTKARPFVPTDLTALGKEVLSDLEVQIQETGAEIALSALPTVEADSTQMRQLFQNIIGNALKYRNPGTSPRIEVSSEAVNGQAAPANGTPAPLCRILFKDNGVGFEEQYGERIFGIFQRLHGRAENEGTGIGLAICRKIVERHGGTIEAQGRPGEGATFTVTLAAHRQTVRAA